MPEFEIRALPDQCTGCLRCMLSCSENATARFSLWASRILVECAGGRCSITFLDGCTGCGLCAEHCLYGALRKVYRDTGG